VAKVFEPRLLLTGVWLGFMGAWLLPNMISDDNNPFLSIVDVIAQSGIGPVPTPAILLGVAGILIVAANMFRIREIKNANMSKRSK
ncbi:MAG: hypothetical protein QM612_01635, partial [Thermomonas sp.]|uniref:hypothetical protein n=1 Tax=Thermomonas sp. TaxID=1971895 RepID=UPI0039E5F45F